MMCRFRQLLLALLAFLPVLAAAQCVSLTSTSNPYTQNFDTLASSGTSTTLPSGWLMLETGTGANTTYTAGTGSGTSGDTYSFGSTGSTERALGSLQSGSVIPMVGVCFVNNTGAALGSLNIGYTGEQWRLGAVGRVDRLDFQYSLDASSLSTGAWVDLNALDFVAPISAGATGAMDGNAVANRTALSSSISGLNIPNGATFYLRWVDLNATSSDDGLAVDDFSLLPVALLIQPDLTVSSVSAQEGNSGITTFTFTVSLSSPAGASGVNFDIATANGSAIAGSDYTPKSLTGQTIPAGQSSYNFTVDVLGDTLAEGNETFTVVVSNLTGANSVGPVGTGTILNDDSGVQLTINNVSQQEGNSGTSIFTFTVSLSAAAPVGGVTFDIATADGTATTANGDYVARSLTSQAIAAGSTSYTFDVVVNGDTTAESDELFFVNVTNVAGAVPQAPQGTGTILTDDISRIHAVQGSGTASPLSGQVVTVEGIVTQVSQGPGTLLGFFIQEPDARVDADPLTSEGIFIFTNANPASVFIGDLVRVTGLVTEFGTAPNTLTEIGTPAAAPIVSVVSSNNGLPAFATVSLPVAAQGDLERYEGMRVRFNQTLTVSDHFSLAQFGEISLSVNGRAFQPSNVVDPNDANPEGTSSSGAGNVAAVTAYADLNARSRIILDGSTTTYSSTVPFIDPVTQTLRLGSTVSDVTGVLGQLGGTHRVHPDVSPVFTYAARPATPPAVGGNVKVGSMNVLNYFNGDGSGAGFPTSRGATSAAEFARQRAKVIAAILGLGADVVGILEMENDGDSATSALQDLVNGLNASAGAGTWAFVPTPVGYTSLPGGSDLIRPAILYKPAVVGLVGASVASSDAAFANARAPIAQTFRLLSNDERFTLVVNHFKSKSSGGASGLDTDQGDGQGAYNNLRKLQASALIGFLSSLTAQTPRIITMGDFNAYEQEDPIDILRAGGLATLVNGDHSYMFDGLSGSLDHALGTSALVSAVTGAGHWHINADEPVFIDYNVENKNTAGCSTACTLPDYFAATPYRASDHDPVLVGLQLDAVQCSVGTWSANGNAPCTPASPGNFVSTAGATSQTACAAGTFQPASGAASCLSAEVGNFVSTTGATSQTACDVGTFQPATGAVACIPAAAGYFVSVTGAATQTACAVGSFQPNTAAALCLPASAGSFVSVLASTTQTECAAGSYQPQTGQSSCLLASAGNFVTNTGAVAQTQCAAGYFQPAQGALLCLAAQAGNFAAGLGNVAQTACTAGSYQPDTAQSSCILASPGFYVPTSGATSQTACAPGTTSSAGATVCTPDNSTVTLLVTLLGSGSGVVTSNPAGITCGADCSESLSSGTAVTLTATAGQGAAFAGWAGVTCAGGNAAATCSFTLTANTTVTATFDSSLVVPNDFNDDARSDLLWRNGGDGSVQGWLMNGLAATQVAGLLPAGGYTVTHVADLDGNGKADTLIRHTDGTTIGWLHDGLNVVGQATFFAPGSGWSIKHTADLNGDGKADLIVENTDGTVIGWLMNGLTVTGTATFVPAGTGWSVSRVGDLNGDGKADLIWQNSNGTVQAWLMDGLSATQTATFVGAGTGWSVKLIADFNGDNKADLVWQNTDGTVQAWLMDGTAITQIASFVPAGTGWSPVLAGDIDGDGKADLFWEHTDGRSQTWLMNGLSVTNLAGFVGAGGWKATHLLDLNGDGKKDVLWKHTDGTVQAWLMNGLSISQIASLASSGSYEVIPLRQ